MKRPLLHGYWRSTASWRVRIALALKGIDFDQVTHDLRRGEQRSETFLSLASQGLVPAFEVGGGVLVQSLAILEWLEEQYPAPPLLPESAMNRAIVRGMTDLIACDIQPVNNLRVLQALRSDFGASEVQVRAWVARWIGDGFASLEQLVERYGGIFSFGDGPSFADCALVPQIYSARRFGVELTHFPRLVAIEAHAGTLPPFAAAHPNRQPDFNPSASSSATIRRLKRF
ncbi:MAG TPA: maleylacetoacetate isomerase [Caulobacteraceae bacterium]